jgi:hypothetical protein
VKQICKVFKFCHEPKFAGIFRIYLKKIKRKISDLNAENFAGKKRHARRFFITCYNKTPIIVIITLVIISIIKYIFLSFLVLFSFFFGRFFGVDFWVDFTTK